MSDTQTIKYRRATTKDLKAVQIFVDDWLSGRAKRRGLPGAGNDYFVSRAQHEVYLRSCVVYVAEICDEIVGWAVKERSNVLIHLLVDGRFRGRGIGCQLLTRLNPDVIRSKSDQSTGNPAAFYEKHGYTRVSHRQVGKKRNIDLMVKRAAVAS
jgi:N-acetylglutamate synthase-like GNAT family acetyltransferase